MVISNRRVGRVIAAAALLPAILLAVSARSASAADDAAPVAATTSTESHAVPMTKATTKAKAATRVESVDDRIADLHKKLRITPDQEALWNDVAQAMRTNGQKMHDSYAERSAKLSSMTAIDDLHSYEMIAEEHAEGLKLLVPAFEALYAKMSPMQQKHADRVFAQQQQAHTHKG